MNKILEIGEEGLKLIKEFESFESNPYVDPGTGGEPITIGFGTTRYFDTKKKVTLEDKAISIQQADRLIRGEIKSLFAPLVDKLCRDDLNQNEFDAVCSFVYNAGATYRGKDGKNHYYNIFNNINNYMIKEDLIEYWKNLAITGGGKKLKGLAKRRKKEVELFFKK